MSAEPVESSATTANTLEDILARAQSSIRLGTILVQTYQEEMPDYSKLSSATIVNDIMPNSEHLIEVLLDMVRHDRRIDPAFEHDLRQSAVRRYHQGVSIQALLQSYRLWGKVIWREVLGVIDRSNPREIDAAFEVSQRIMEHVDRASIIVADSYFAELSGVSRDRGVLRSDVLEQLLKLRSDTPQSQAVVTAVTRDLDEYNAVQVIRAVATDYAGGWNLRDAIDIARGALKGNEGQLIIGLRERELVLIRSTPTRQSNDSLKEESETLAKSLPRHVVAYGRSHPGPAGIGTSYGEAAEAADVAVALERTGKPTSFVEILFQHISRASSHSQNVIESTLEPVRTYDQEHNSTLLATLQAYFDSRFSLTRSAEVLHVHPNTVTYRLRRINELTGLDTFDPDDLLLLVLGLKLAS